ncbi:hypothetical protein IU448_15115 [Nocardia flavorosea]|uniref:hypothetical protein n=1 Tax=Nocardia flavorosea TaxID=53429 RepID=UPI0018954C36|nr:hypothetical protein [Nocardia flavorosea]MBF6350336.1 hypothetical protein [Nocardia flavorosea]
MSWQAVKWSTTQVPPGLVKLAARAVLDVYAEAADEHGRQSYQSHLTVAWRLGCTVRNVSDHVESLRSAGLLVKSADQSAVAHLPADTRPVVYDLPIHWVREDTLDDFREEEKERRRRYRKPKTGSAEPSERYEENFLTGMQNSSYREPERYEENFRHGMKDSSPRYEENFPDGTKKTSDKPSLGTTQGTTPEPSGSTAPQLNLIETPAPEPKNRLASKPGDPDGFVEFWEVYPRRVARGAAVKAYAKAIKKADPAAIREGARRYAETRRGKDSEFTAHAASWLNAERWADEPDPVQAAPMSKAMRAVQQGEELRARLAAGQLQQFSNQSSPMRAISGGFA